jgi:hypothetical protein
LTLFLVPFALVGWAWGWFQKNSNVLVESRRRTFSVALVGSVINNAVILVFFVVHNVVFPAMGYSVHGRILRTVTPSIFLAERIVEWTGAICAVFFFVLAFTGIGKARILLMFAAFCNFYMWAATL